VHAVVALLTDDVQLSMPPWPFQYRGRELAARFHEMVTFREGRTYRLIPTRANGQPAFGVYTKDLHARVLHANGLMVLTLAGDHPPAARASNHLIWARLQPAGWSQFTSSRLGHFETL
jgi:RNA polymerase sigma-70 factor (ECF subfamily)